MPAGTYTVPSDVPEMIAERAIGEGVGKRLNVVVVEVPRKEPEVRRRQACETVAKQWDGLCIVAAPGPSLTEDVAAACKGIPTIVVNDAYRLFPDADVLYASDPEWWALHDGVKDFKAERWSSHGGPEENDKRETAAKYGLRLVRGANREGFATDPSLIHYGQNSGFQGVNLALHKMGFAGTILLVGFDMKRSGGKAHFFGDHPNGLRTTSAGSYKRWAKSFEQAGKSLPVGIRIVNCTPNSALKCFEMADLNEVLSVAC